MVSRVPPALARAAYSSARVAWVSRCAGSSSRMVLQIPMALARSPCFAYCSATAA